MREKGKFRERGRILYLKNIFLHAKHMRNLLYNLYEFLKIRHGTNVYRIYHYAIILIRESDILQLCALTVNSVE